MSEPISLVCSNRPRPSVQNGHSYQLKTGASAWGRDVYHAYGGNNATECGIHAGGWLNMDPLPLETVLADDHFCTRCAAKLKAG